MKENTETISEIIFTHFPSAHAKSKRNLNKKLTSLLFSTLKKRILVFKNQLIEGVASLGIGIIFLFAVYLFFSQLAEHGWQ
jgi:hypothetical protein